MSLAIQSFGQRLSFELIRDGVTIGGLAYASKIRSPKGNAAFSAARAHVHGVDVEIEPQKTNASSGPVEFELEKDDYDFGLLKYDWRGRCKLGLTRVDGGRDEFKIKPKGISDFWFLVEHNNYPVMELRPTKKYRQSDYNFDVRMRSRRIPERVIDELCIYVGFAANIYMTKIVGANAGR
ncbi:hypothetical protein [Litorimonas sp. WD9-15]|uniref:hypothetical protein n=1 Tax=Litorimonas sp. WD9-15 TaxID=3418716 RepID=UPI003D06D979